MSAEKQENGHRNSRYMKLDYEHGQEPLGKDYRGIFSCWLFGQTVENQINFDQIIKTCNGMDHCLNVLWWFCKHIELD